MIVLTIEQRQKLTQWLARALGVAVIASSVLIALLLASILRPAGNLMNSMMLTGGSVAAAGFISGALWIWRKCDRCGYRILHPQSGITGYAQRKGQARMPNHRARKILGSYYCGALVEAATGGAHCLWCGHEDGTKPDYVVTAP